MGVLDWISILTIISILIALASTIRITFSSKSAYLILLSLSLVSYLASNCFYLIDSGLDVLIKWSNLLSLCFLLSGLFDLIRASKPIFASFPVYLIYIPFIIPFFFPLIINQTVLSNLLIGVLQLGCIIVSIMMYSIHQLRSGNSLAQLIGSVSLLVAFITFWILDIEDFMQNILTQILIVIGIMFISFGIQKSKKAEIHDKKFSKH